LADFITSYAINNILFRALSITCTVCIY